MTLTPAEGTVASQFPPPVPPPTRVRADGLGQRHHPGGAHRRPVRAVRLRALADVRGHEGGQPGPRRPGRGGRVRGHRRHHRHPHPGPVVVRDRGPGDGGVRLHTAAHAHPGRAGPGPADHADRHLRAVGGHRKRAAPVLHGQQPGHRHRAVPGPGLVHHRLPDPDRLPAGGHLRGGRDRPARAAVLPVRVPVRPDDPGRGRRPGGGPAVRRRLPARVRHRGRDRVRDRGPGRHGLRHVLPAGPDHRHRHDPAVRVRRGGHRRARLAVGHPARRRGAGRGPADRGPDQHLRRGPGRVHRVPGRAGAQTPGPDQPEVTVMSTVTETPETPGTPAQPGATGNLRVTRSRRNVAWTGLGALVVVIVLALLPYLVYSGTTSIFVQGFIVLTLASMWNLLAGYAGLVSVGQQVFVGLGAYFVLILAIHGWSPFAALPIAAIGCAVAALPLWWLVSRLRSGYFAIATWVLAATVMLVIEKFSSIGGGTGMPLPGFAGLDPVLLTAYTYWAGLAVTVAALVGIYLMLRGRIGLVLTAVRDDEVAARSSGARVGLARVLVFVIAGAGCGGAGAVLAISQLQVQPGAVFSVQWTAEMAFATIIGGLGTIEGPIVGTIVYMVLQQTLQSYNAWYLIILGLVAILIALFFRRGLWGLVDERLNLRLFPVGYWLWPEDTPRRRGRRRGRQGAS